MEERLIGRAVLEEVRSSDGGQRFRVDTENRIHQTIWLLGIDRCSQVSVGATGTMWSIVTPTAMKAHFRPD